MVSSLDSSFLADLRSNSKLRERALLYDRVASLEAAANDGAKAAATNDTRKLYMIVKSLAGVSVKPAAGICDEVGIMLEDKAAISDRWTRYARDLFRGEIASDIECLDKGSLVDLSNVATLFAPTVEGTESAIKKLRGGGALGPDKLPGSLLQAGGRAAAEIIHCVLELIFLFGYVPLVWRGGRYILLFKKGDASKCNSYRGLLVSDHIGKIVASVVQTEIDARYCQQVGADQYGAVRGRGTALAQFLVRNFLDFCTLFCLSSMVLFLDLSKAFDFAPREIVMGWCGALPLDDGVRRNFLLGRGVPAD